MKLINKSRTLGRFSGPARHWAIILAALLLTGFVHQAGAQTWTLTNIWNVAAGTEGLSTGSDGGNRSVAYNAISNQVFVSYRAGGSNLPIMVFDGTAGTWISGASGVTGSLGSNCDQIGVGDDGVLYGCPLNTGVTSSSPFKVYSWASWNVSPLIAFSSGATDPIVTAIGGTKRIGDSMAVTGAGTNTLILAGVGGTGAFVLLSVNNGVVGNFTSTVLTNSTIGALPNVCGLCFYTNNTFLVIKGNGTTYLMQYPTNYASLPSPVTAAVLGSAGLTGTTGDTELSYSSAGQLLGAMSDASGTTSPAILFNVAGFPTTAASSVASTNISTVSGNNGNDTGGVALGGTGKTNWLYALPTDNGLHAYQIIFTPGAAGPTVSVPTGGITNAYPPQTLSVTATGTAPLYYQWYVITGPTNSLTTNAIIGANTNFYTVSTPVTNLYYVVVTNMAPTANVVTSSVVGLSLLTPVTNLVVSQLWSAPIGAYSFLANDNNARGIAFSTNLDVVVVSSTTGAVTINLLNGDTGADIGSLSSAGLPTDNQFVIDQVGVADDGLVYGGCLDVGTASSQYYSLYQWPAATNGGVAAMAYYEGDPGNGSGDRWGDTMAVRGAGTNTQVLLGANASTNVVIFTTPNGTSFLPTLMGINGVPPGFAAKGVAFGMGNTFWAKNYGGDLYEIAYDPVALTNAVIFNYSISGQIPSRLVGVAVDMTNNILAGVNLLDINNDLQLYQLTGSADPPVFFDQAFFPSYNANGNDNAAVVMKPYGNTNRVYALDVNNGIVALTYGVPATISPSISTAPSSETVFSADPSIELTVGVSGSLPIYYQWQLNGTNLPNATNSTYTLANLTTNDSGNYDVIVQNLGGAVTSTPPAVVTIYAPVTNAAVSELWNVAAGGTNDPYQSLNNLTYLTNYPYLDPTTYSARGLAYDPNTSTVLVANNGASDAGAYLGIYVLDANTGTNMFTLNTAGLPTTGVLFPLDLLGVGDDGVVYAANCTASNSAANFSIYSWPNVSPGAFPSYAVQSTDPANGTYDANLDRWGDTMAVRGAGANTQILLGTYYGFDGGPATNAALFNVGSATFTLLTITNTAGVPAGFSMLGIAFGAGNTFWTQSPGYDLREISFDPVSGNCSVSQNISVATSDNSSFSSIGAICLDVSNNIMAGIAFGDIPADVVLYNLENGVTPPYLFDQAFFPEVEANAQNNGATTVKAGRVYSLDANNGIVALAYTVPPGLLPFHITSVGDTAAAGVTLTWQSVPGYCYQVQVASILSGTTTWSDLGAPIVAIGTTTSYSDTSTNASVATGYYQVVGY